MTIKRLPVVTTVRAKEITSDSAKLVGGLDDLTDFGSVDVWFVYWRGMYKYSVIYPTPYEIMTEAGTFRARLTGLKPDTTYYFQACARPSEGYYCGSCEVRGDVLEFTTEPTLP